MPIALSQLPRWGLALAAAVAGSAAVLAFAPFSLWPLAVLAVAAFCQILDRRTRSAGFVAGWGFGLGLLGFGIFWIRISLNEFGNMPPLVAHLLTLVFILAMALYYGLAGWLVRALSGVWPQQGAPEPAPGPATARGRGSLDPCSSCRGSGYCWNGYGAGSSPASPGWPWGTRR